MKQGCVCAGGDEIGSGVKWFKIFVEVMTGGDAGEGSTGGLLCDGGIGGLPIK